MLFKPLVVAYNILFTISMLDQNQQHDIYTYYVLSADCIMIIIMSKNESNKPDRATMRLGCVFACIDHVIYMERQMDEQIGGMTK